MEIIRTIQWPAESPGLFTLCARMSKLGEAKNAHPSNFVELIAAYENCSYQDLVSFAKRWVMSDRFKGADVTRYATLSEDRCLFATHGTHKEALDIVVRYLDILNTTEKKLSPWAFLDMQKKAAVHFVDRQGYYAELYCQSIENCSVLHLLKNHGQYLFVPVVFVPELPKEVVANASLDGVCLQDYLPREKFDCLSNGGKKSNGPKDFRNMDSNPQQVARVHDSWDNL